MKAHLRGPLRAKVERSPARSLSANSVCAADRVKPRKPTCAGSAFSGRDTRRSSRANCATGAFTIFSLWNVLADAKLLPVTIYSYITHGVWIAIETVSLIQNLAKRRAGSATSKA